MVAVDQGPVLERHRLGHRRPQRQEPPSAEPRDAPRRNPSSLRSGATRAPRRFVSPAPGQGYRMGGPPAVSITPAPSRPRAHRRRDRFRLRHPTSNRPTSEALVEALCDDGALPPIVPRSLQVFGVIGLLAGACGGDETASSGTTSTSLSMTAVQVTPSSASTTTAPRSEPRSKTSDSGTSTSEVSTSTSTVATEIGLIAYWNHGRRHRSATDHPGRGTPKSACLVARRDTHRLCALRVRRKCRGRPFRHLGDELRRVRPAKPHQRPHPLGQLTGLVTRRNSDRIPLSGPASLQGGRRAGRDPGPRPGGRHLRGNG